MITYGEAVEDGRTESFVETDEVRIQGTDYYVRLTAVYPYKDYANGSDELKCHIDFRNMSTLETGRYENVMLPAREPGDNNLRRHSLYRHMPSILSQIQPVPSPVFV